MTENRGSLRIQPAAPRQFRQLGVLVLDGSGSMTEMTAGNITKAQATGLATRELFQRLQSSRAAANFVISLITYDDHPTRVIYPPAPVSQLNAHDDYDPTRGHGDGTLIHRALEDAAQVVAEFFAQATPDGPDHRAVILLMTDGLCNEPDATRQVALRIRDRFGAKLTIAGAYFAAAGDPDPEGERLLCDIVSDPVTYFSAVTTGDALRQFFLSSLSRASGIAII